MICRDSARTTQETDCASVIKKLSVNIRYKGNTASSEINRKHIIKPAGRKQNVLTLSLVLQEVSTRLKWFIDQFKPSVVTAKSAALWPQIVCICFL